MKIAGWCFVWLQFVFAASAQTNNINKPVYTSGFIYELRDSLHYFAVKDGINIYGYKLLNPIGQTVHESRGKSSYIAMFKLPPLPDGPYMLLLRTDDAIYARRVYVWPR